MVVAVSAGVFIQEKDDSLYAPAISPTIFGIVGTATKGEENQAVLITNEGQLIDAFGRPRTKDFGLQAAIEALKAGRLVFFVRISGAAATQGLVSVLDEGSGPTAASIGPSANGEPFNLIGGSTESPTGTRTTQIRILFNDLAGDEDEVITFTGVQAVRNNAPGAATYNLDGIDTGNPVFLTLRVDGGPIQTITFASTDPLISNFAAVTPAEIAAVINDQILDGEARFAANVVTIASDTFGDDSTIQVTGGNANTVLVFATTLASGSGDVGDLSAVLGSEIKTVIEAATSLVVDVDVGGEVTISTSTTGAARNIEIVSANSPLVGAAPLVNLTPLDTQVDGTNNEAAANTVRFLARTNGSHSADIDVRVSDSAALAGTKKVEVLVRGVVAEVFDKLLKSPTPIAGSDDLIDTINDGSDTQPASELIEALDLNPTGENPADGTHALSTGNDGDDWTAGSVVGTVSGDTRTGLQIFGDPDNIYINVLATPGISYASVIAEMLNICQTRGDALAVIDAPQNLTVQEVVQWHNGDNSIGAVVVDQEGRTETNTTLFNSSYGALYYPFVQVFDKYNDEEIFIPPSGMVMRTLAHTDQVADPWFAPAGPTRSQATSVLELAYNATQGEQDLMQLPGNNVNPIRNISGVGVIIMGQKTLQRAPTALDRVNVRRLLLAIEKVIAQSVFFLLFEPNDQIMWRRFVNLVTPVMEDVKNRRGVFDYRVIADSSTNTPLLIDQNTFLGKILLKPTKAAEKMIVSFNLVPTGANFEEFAQA